MVYECKTKYKGKWYMPGEEVPEEKSQVPSDFMNPPKNPITYTKTEINRMSTADLQKLAAEQGIEKRTSDKRCGTERNSDCKI